MSMACAEMLEHFDLALVELDPADTS